MKELETHFLQRYDPFLDSAEWKRVKADISASISAIVWPLGSDRFTINPVKTGNGVVPISKAFQEGLADLGWGVQKQSIPNVGKVDAALETELGTFAVEWETGNISSSHRSLNRLVLGIQSGDIVGGVLVLPSRRLYRFLTDRIGNIQELEKYFSIYRKIEVPPSILAVVVVEHDEEDPTVDRITKSTDGRALFQKQILEDER